MSDKGIAVVTGASSGIGAEYARRLAERGHPLYLVARRVDRLQELADRLIAEHGIRVDVRALDLVNPDDLHALEYYISQNPIEILVNNAGAGGLGPTSKTGAEMQETLIKLNIVAVTRLSVAALAGFRDRGKGSLVNIASVIAFGPSAGGAAYSGSKAFVLNFTRSLQMEYRESDIRIQVVLPGPIRTEFFTSQGLRDSVFPDASYITADALVAAALEGLDRGEDVTIPTLGSMATWEELEAVRSRFLLEVACGQVAERYR